MGIEIQGRVGPGYAADGTIQDPRLTKDLGLAVQDLHGRFYEAVVRGTVYEAVTASTGVAPGTAFGTTAAFTLYNPIGSGKNLVVVDTDMGYVSGTLGSGTVYLCANTNPNAAAVTGTAITPVNLLIGGAPGVGKAFTTSTLPVAPTAIHPVWTLAPMLATTVFAPTDVRIVFDGKYIITPGCSLSFEAIAGAGTTPLLTFSMSWEEVSI